MPKMEESTLEDFSPEDDNEDFKILIPKRNTDPDTESGDSQDEIDEILRSDPQVSGEFLFLIEFALKALHNALSAVTMEIYF